MFRLFLYVPGHQVQLRHADAERAIFFLPGEEPLVRKGFMDPLAGPAFNKLQSLRYGDAGRQGQQHMDVVGNAADLKCFELVPSGNPPPGRARVFHAIER